MTAQEHLKLDRVRKSFDDTLALDDVSFDVGSHEFVCLLGPSGCGKTTLLRLIAGLMPVDGGRLLLQGQDLTRTPARARGFGIVFQSYSLFPAMTVAANIGYGMKIRGVATAEIRRRVAELLEMIQLPNLGDRYPWQLSGGQQQRVAFARAVAVKPRLLLLDEPLSALDAQVRSELRQEIRSLQRALGIPTVMVTHDQEEALTLADRIVCMQQGRIAQVGTPQALYCQPATRFVADFMGVSNLIPRELAVRIAPGLAGDSPGRGALACIRPEQLVLTRGADQASVKAIQFLGNISRIQVEMEGMLLTAEQSGQSALVEGDRVGISLAYLSCAWVAAD
jgi:iron(III) transport system ATP-binding protein